MTFWVAASRELRSVRFEQVENPNNKIAVRRSVVGSPVDLKEF
jgi:hypothetical protein